MSNLEGYKRLFFIFQSEDKGSGGMNGPSGYLRIIQNGSLSKASIDLTNFNIEEDAHYEVIFIFHDEKRKNDFPIYASFDLKSFSGKAFDDFSFDSYNVGGCGLSLKNLWGAVIYLRSGSKATINECFPLKSIKNEDRPWKNALLNKLKNDYVKEANHDNAHTHSTYSTTGEDDIMQKSDQVPYSDTDTVGKNSREFVKKAVDQIFKHTIEPKPKQDFLAAERERKPEKSSEERLVEILETRFESNKDEDTDTLFDNNFEKCDPFGTTNHSYRWWKCRDMHKINEVLLSIDIGIPFELNKDGYIACESYGHVVVGLYNDKKTTRSFVVIGIPAEDKDSVGNYHNNSRWEKSEEGFTPSGYWLTYVDMKTSNVIKATY